MPSSLYVFFGLAIIVCTVVLIDAVVSFLRALRGGEDGAIDRRLSEIDGREEQIVVATEREEAVDNLFSHLSARLKRLADHSGSKTSVPKLLALIAFLSVLAIVVLLILMPRSYWYASVPLGLATGVTLVVMALVYRRNARLAKFEVQFPDAIDLIVRSLKVGHPLSSCLSIIAIEMPAPMGEEFLLAHYKVSYGSTVSAAFREMAERVPHADLNYLVAVVQMQEETGGNLVESLGKLANIIRERLRMFRKVKALTAEGRMSAWLLSAFPFATTIAMRFIKPDYYDKIMQMDDFPIVALVLAVMLVLNILVMNAITKIKV